MYVGMANASLILLLPHNVTPLTDRPTTGSRAAVYFARPVRSSGGLAAVLLPSGKEFTSACEIFGTNKNLDAAGGLGAERGC